MYLSKYSLNANYQYKFLLEVDRAARANNIVYCKPKILKYSFIIGKPAKAWTDVHTLAQKYLWNGVARNAIDVNLFIENMAKLSHILSPELRGLLLKLCNEHLSIDTLTPVRLCHGNLILSHCIQEPSRNIRFISPRDPLGLYCKELDEAAIYLSLDGWDSYRYDHSTIGPFQPTTIHKILMCTHYLRILHEKHPIAALKFAREKIETHLLQIKETSK